MLEWIHQNLPFILAGISVGGQYALIAIGYTMVYGILRLINFAHGDIFMVSGVVMVYATTLFTRQFPNNPGVVLVMASSLSYALYIVVVNRASLNMSSVKLTFYVLLFGVAAIVLYSLC